VPAVLLDWDTEFWGFPIGRVTGRVLTRRSLRAADAWAQERAVRCLYFLASSDDPGTAHVAEQGGFRLMDLRVELRREAGDALEVGAVREAREEDRSRLREIARTSHGTTRFYADPGFADDRCDDLYETWIERSLSGWAAGVLVFEREGSAAGYCSCHIDERGRAGSIGLIAVDSSARRSGAGTALANGAVAWCASKGADEMSVVTQGRNVPALRTFQRAGFLVTSVDVWFHKWYER
jgi:dTDP-4-amino-4,6-dideoxy-D-galactose acyltransferase